nr:hypothetical protein Iba_chr10eCG8170 [Ipomoea batatas]
MQLLLQLEGLLLHKDLVWKILMFKQYVDLFQLMSACESLMQMGNWFLTCTALVMQMEK